MHARPALTARSDSDKKVAQSWGADEGTAELKAEEAGATDAVVDNAWGEAAAPADDPWAAPAAAADGAAPAPVAEEGEGRRREREPEEEDNTLTFDQYLAQKAEADAADSVIPKLAPRAANEGAEGDIWKDAVPVARGGDEDEAYFAGKPKAAPKERAKKAEKVYLEIDARFERPDSGRGGRGGRGGPRGGDRDGGRGRGTPRGGRGEGRGPRGGRGASAGVDVADEKAFPSLS